MATQSRTVEWVLAKLAAASHGVGTRLELVDAGVTADEIAHRLRIGALQREHHGVYRVGHRAPSVEARYLAAVRACGDAALLCGLAAAFIWGLIKGEPPPPEVLAPTERRVKGVNTRRSRTLRAADAARFRGVR